MNAAERFAVIVTVWLLCAAIIKVRRWWYGMRTQGWLPLSSDTAWMLEAGYRCELPPSFIGPVGVAIVVTIGVVLA